MGCITAILQMSSCTTDSDEDLKNYPSKNFSTSATEPHNVTTPPLDEIGDRDKSKTKV